MKHAHFRKRSRPVSRVLSRTVIHLDVRHRTPQATYPGTDTDRVVCQAFTWQEFPYLVLLRVGFTVPSYVTTDAVRSYRTISPLPVLRKALRRYTFCCTGRGLTSPRCYLAPCPVEPGLSSLFRRNSATVQPTPKPALYWLNDKTQEINRL